MASKSIEEYLSLPYTIEVTKDLSGDHPVWFACVRELPGCATEADSFEEVGEMIEDAMRLWIEVALDTGMEVPEPQEAPSFSGKFMVRVPRSLHKSLSEAAERDDVSLNAWVTTQLARAVGGKQEKSMASGASLDANSPKVRVPSVEWSSLSAAAFEALAASGTQGEAERIDERFFAEWINERVSRARKHIFESNDFAVACEILEEVERCMQNIATKSPVIASLHETVSFLIDICVRRLDEIPEGEELSSSLFRDVVRVSMRSHPSVRRAVSAK